MRTTKRFPYRVSSETLQNGLRVMTVELPHLHSALLALYVRAGSRHEAPDTSGVGHFLEHMFFRGSRAFPDSVAMHAAVEDAGGNLNGYTSRDHAVYFTPLHPGGLAVTSEVLADMIAAPLLREMKLEREVILEEMLDEVDEHGKDVDIENLTKRLLWPDHPLSLKIAGTPQTVKALTLRDLRAHHRRFYVGSNLVLCAAGPLDHGDVVAEARRRFGRFPSGARSSEAPPPKPPAGPRFRLFPHEESQTELRLSFPGPPEEAPDFLALGLARRVLDDGLSSRLPLEIVERRGLCYSLHCGIDSFEDVSVLEVEAATSHGKVAGALREICRILGELAQKGPSKDELARAKARHRMALEFTLDSANDMAAWFGGTSLFRAPPSLEQRADDVDAIDAAQLRDAMRRVVQKNNLLVTAVGSPNRRQLAEIRQVALAAKGL
ncbi:MAG: M16 family metallopeptidase [Deltaproteobacteria bacterium]